MSMDNGSFLFLTTGDVLFWYDKKNFKKKKKNKVNSQY